MTSEYLIWSNEHSLWWAPVRLGYSNTIKGAGRYSREEALDICVRANYGLPDYTNPNEIPILLEDAIELFSYSERNF